MVMKILNVLKNFYKKIIQHIEYRKLVKKINQEDPFIYK